MFFAIYALSAGVSACLVMIYLRRIIQQAKLFQGGTGANPWLIGTIVVLGTFCAVFLPVANTLVVIAWCLFRK